VSRASEGKPGQRNGELQERVVNGLLTKQRIHALVGQVLDELDNRRAAGKGDFVAAIADEVEQGGLAALQQLKALLPDDAKLPIGGLTMNVNQMFLDAMKTVDTESIGNAAASTGVILDAAPVYEEPETVEW
jgi:hypothetical protein